MSRLAIQVSVVTVFLTILVCPTKSSVRVNRLCRNPLDCDQTQSCEPVGPRWEQICLDILSPVKVITFTKTAYLEECHEKKQHDCSTCCQNQGRGKSIGETRGHNCLCMFE